MPTPLNATGGRSPSRKLTFVAVVVVVAVVGWLVQTVNTGASALFAPVTASPAGSPWVGTWMNDGGEFALIELRAGEPAAGRMVVARDAASDVGAALEDVNLSDPHAARFALCERGDRHVYRLATVAPDVAELSFEPDVEFARDRYLRGHATGPQDSLHSKLDRDRFVKLQQKPPPPHVVGTFRRIPRSTP